MSGQPRGQKGSPTLCFFLPFFTVNSPLHGIQANEIEGALVSGGWGKPSSNAWFLLFASLSPLPSYSSLDIDVMAGSLTATLDQQGAGGKTQSQLL